jgi:2-oxoglutarate dehydrogenase E1 component
VLQGAPVRISGQDVTRGTFSHRHAGLFDVEDGRCHFPLQHLADKQGAFEVYNSLLSEAAVLGFEYGYTLTDPMTLVLWEAQFGDFANGAQVIIDQFVASAAVKWGRISGLVMLLPHGYEGQGPEHSSARIERYLQLCAEDNMQVVNCTTPAQYFHVLRRQMRRNFRAPLIVFTPKSLLRSPRAVSKPEELANGRFHPVLGDAQAERQAQRIRRALLCSGKVYYELLEAREKRKADDVAVVRVEQLYPWPAEELAAALAPYAGLEHAVWVQEEPRNMGGWSFVREQIEESPVADVTLRYAGRPAYAAPAGGSMRLHRKRQAALIAQAFGDDVPVV